MELNKNVVISDENCIGKEETYQEYFKCPNCNDTDLINSFNYCPNCGCKLEWNLIKDFSINEEVTIKSGKLSGISGNVYDFNRRNKKVTIVLDKNNTITVDYDDIIRI